MRRIIFIVSHSSIDLKYVLKFFEEHKLDDAIKAALQC